MESLTFFTSQPKKYTLFLNTSFLFLLLFYITTTTVLNQSKGSSSTTIQFTQYVHTNACSGLHEHTDYQSKCAYVQSNNACKPKGYINYLEIFYCSCGQLPILGYAILFLWLVLLFYMLANTAADYFCPSLESLSKILNLSPTIAGTTLLPLGNGATDVFSSIISFTRSGDGDVGLNIVLGGAFFISSVVVGIISIAINSHEISVDKPSFIRDVLFFLFSLSSLFFIIMVGKISLWGAISFVSLYFVYIFVVSVMHFFHGKKDRVVNLSSVSPTSMSFLGEFGEIGIPLMGCVDEEKAILVERGDFEALVQKPRTRSLNLDSSIWVYLAYVLEMPLYLPRRLTIPVVREDRWSKPFAVISVTLAPILLATLWNTQRENMASKTSLVNYMTSGLMGFVLGNIVFVATNKSSPPKQCLFPWLAGGFLMSITWTYIVAEELVSLLVSFGNILGISPSILGLTVLAWGNSTGDLMANVAVAMKGGPDGAQIAMSGCYAGPVFNTMVGLGMSLVLAAWSEYPSSYVIPSDPYLYEILGFLMAGLLWALVILPKKNMRLDKSLGVGLLTIYFCFLFVRFARAFGVIKLDGSYMFKL
ncbi:Cation/calcium exchanger 1 [Camellia lanceoleosa]|uniref:Cation/calcium exchanger 1 n=1 Tax=Camellia lanceoleosa TaxID=1840588 RepID=A0ACC0FNT6_9ERIC|nr:Cation/calcium exchanger 1 [Camellia lanceoleosa]